MTHSEFNFAPVPKVLEAFAAGQMVIVVDDEDRENEGDLIVAAHHATPEVINFMATHARGLICLAIPQEDATRLRLEPMADENTDPQGTAFTVSIDARDGVTTGISAADRARTIQVTLDPNTRPSDLRRPGHHGRWCRVHGGRTDRLRSALASDDDGPRSDDDDERTKANRHD